MGKVVKYTQEEIDKMIEMYNQGNSCKRIAEVLCRNEDSVRKKLKDYNVFKPIGNVISDNELENITNDYKAGMRPCELANKYNRNAGTIISRLKSIGVYVDSRNNYTKEDEEFIKECYVNEDWDRIFERFPTVSKQSIRVKMSKMGIKHPIKWTEFELNYVKDNYYCQSLDEIEKALNYKRTKDAIQTKALKYFGYSKDISWTDDEEQILLKYYSVKSVDEVCDMLPNRTREAIIAHAKVLGVKSYDYIQMVWSQKDTDFLLQNWKNYTDLELCDILSKDINSIKNKRWSYGLKRIGIDNGKYTDIKKYLRSKIWEWKSDSMKSCNYMCVFTGSKEFEVHHLYSFNDIVNKVMIENSIEVKPVLEYSNSELSFIQEMFLNEHKKYPLGICMRSDIHSLYHKIYGKSNINEQQFNKFKLDVINNKYDKIVMKN